MNSMESAPTLSIRIFFVSESTQNFGGESKFVLPVYNYFTTKLATMPKANKHKRNSASGAQGSSPYGGAATPQAKSNAVFKMNTDLGQHILKNPGIAQAIVDKADLKQSDVSAT